VQLATGAARYRCSSLHVQLATRAPDHRLVEDGCKQCSYTYIYIERERKINIDIYIYIYIVNVINSHQNYVVKYIIYRLYYISIYIYMVIVI